MEFRLTESEMDDLLCKLKSFLADMKELNVGVNYSQSDWEEIIKDHFGDFIELVKKQRTQKE